MDIGVSESKGTPGTWGLRIPQFPLTRASSLPAVLSMAPMPVLLPGAAERSGRASGSGQWGGAGRLCVQSPGGEGLGKAVARLSRSPADPGTQKSGTFPEVYQSVTQPLSLP